MKLQAKHSAAAAGPGKITIAHSESSTWHHRRAGVLAHPPIWFPVPADDVISPKLDTLGWMRFAKVSFGLLVAAQRWGFHFGRLRRATLGAVLNDSGTLS